jgi:hypothetical protein
LGWWNLQATVNHLISFSVLNNGKSIAMDLSKKIDTSSVPMPLINDKLNIYRIVDGTYRVSHDTPQPIVPTFTLFKIEKMFFTNDEGDNDDTDLSGIPEGRLYLNQYMQSNHVNFNYLGHPLAGLYGVGDSWVQITIENTGIRTLYFEAWEDGNPNLVSSWPGGGTIPVGQSITFYHGYNAHNETNVLGNNPSASKIYANFVNFNFRAKGNYDWSEEFNKYLKTSVKFTVNASWHGFKHGQSVENLNIISKCGTDCYSKNNVFGASDSPDGNIFYADSYFKAAWPNYYERDGNNGYPTSGAEGDWDFGNENVQICGMYFNPGKYCTMRQTEDGVTYSMYTTSDPSECVTQRLNGGGSMCFFWSKYPANRKNPNDQNSYYSPLAAIISPNNWSDFWNTPAYKMATYGY